MSSIFNAVRLRPNSLRFLLSLIAAVSLGVLAALAVLSFRIGSLRKLAALSGFLVILLLPVCYWLVFRGLGDGNPFNSSPYGYPRWD